MLEGISLYVYQILFKQADDSQLGEPKFYILEDRDNLKISAGFGIAYKEIKFDFRIFTKAFIDYLTIKTEINKEIKEKIQADNLPNKEIIIVDNSLSITIKLQNVPIRGNQLDGIDENLSLTSYLDEIVTINQTI